MKRTRVFLGNAPWKKDGFYGVRAGSRWPHFEEQSMEYMPFPFFLAYATAVLERDGFPVLLVDGIAEGITDEAFLARIRDFRPDVIVLEISTNSYDKDMYHVARIREEHPDKIIVLAGLHDEMFRTPWLREHTEVNAVLVGEYEMALLEFARRLESGTSPVGTVGLLWRDADGDVFDGGRRPLEPDLSVFPWPARHFLPMYAYRDEPGNIPRPSVQMWASRGCPYGCTFCAWPQIMYASPKYRVRPVEDVVDEMEWLAREYNFASAYFDDDTFNIGKKRMLAFAREVKSRNMDLPFGIMARADLMDREILTELKEAGLWGLKYGVESATQEIVDACDKGLELEKVKRAVEFTHELGIKMHLTFMFGLPGETWDSAMKTIDMAIAFAPESVQFTVATPFPGSKYWNEITSEGKLRTRDFSKYDGFRSAVVRTDALSGDQLEEILRIANQRWSQFRFQRAG